MITKNILYKYFKDFADNHLQIKDYGYGDLWEISSSQATTYPLFWVSPQPSNISGNEITYNFNILIGDRLEDGDANKVEVESDTFQIGLDLLATLNINRDVDLDKNNTLTPFIHDFKDRIAGHLITLSVTADFDYNECAVPTTGTPTPPTSSCPVAIITINGVAYGSVGSGNTEDIAVVNTLGVPVGSLISGNWVVTASGGDATAVLKNSAGTTISTTIIASGGTSNITAPDGSAVLKNTLNTTLSTTSILSNGSSNITAPDSTSVLKDTAGTTLSTTTIASGVSTNVTAPDSTAVIKDDSGNILKTSVIPSNVSQDVTINDSTAVLKNTLATTLSTTSINAESSANITAPDSTITINSASFSPYPSGATSNILVKDGTGTQVGSKVGSEWIVPTGGGGTMTANFSADILTAEVGQTITFTDTSDNSPTEWAWDFNGEGSSNLQNPIFQFDSVGLKTITLLAAKDGVGDFVTKSNYIQIVQDNIVTDFLTATSISDTTIISALTQLVYDLRVNNLLSKFTAIYPFVGGTATTHKFNLLDPQDTNGAYRLVFSGGWTHTSRGIKPNGTNASADTFLAQNVLAQNDVHVSVYLMDNLSSSGAVSGVDIATGATFYLSSWYQGVAGGISNVNNTGLQVISRTDEAYFGFYIASRLSSTTRKFFLNGKLKDTFVATSNTPSSTTFKLSLGSVGEYSIRGQAFTSLGAGLTDSEADLLNTIVSNYQNILTRRV
jgi:PKD repeat protein